MREGRRRERQLGIRNEEVGEEKPKTRRQISLTTSHWSLITNKTGFHKRRASPRPLAISARVSCSSLSPLWFFPFVPLCRKSGDAAQRSSRLDIDGKPMPVPFQLAKVALHLDSMPELVRLTKEGAKANRHGRCNRPPSMHYFVDCTWGNPDCAGHGIL